MSEFVRLMKLVTGDDMSLLASHIFKTQIDANDIHIKKLDDEEQIVFGEVYAPGYPDSQGDRMTAAEVKKMAYNFMAKGITGNVDVFHSQKPMGAKIVESFIARKDDTIFIPESWVVGVHVPDPAIWRMVKSGELNGFSLDGYGVRDDQTFELEMPEILKGETMDEKDHRHPFSVRYDTMGNFRGGMTGPALDGHVHKIERGTVTEVTNGHSHKFSYVEGILHAQVQH